MTWSLQLDVDFETANANIAQLERAGLLGLSEQDGQVTAWFAERVDGLPLGGRWVEVPDQDWNATWKTGIEPVTVRAVTVTPPWIDVVGALVIEPAMAFGTGHHETTAGCLDALQDAAVDGCSVLDVGTGTGLLALAARKLGATSAVAVDTDQLAVDAARENAARNGLDLDVRLGSVDAADGVYDIVLANLDSASLLQLAAALTTKVAPEGRLVASGVQLDRADDVARALTASGLAVDVRPGEEWAVLVGIPEQRRAE